MRKNICLMSLSLVFIFFLSNINLVKASDLTLSTNQLISIYKKENPDYNKTELEYYIKDLNYEADLEEYEDKENNVNLQKTILASYEQLIDYNIQEENVDSQEFKNLIYKSTMQKESYKKSMEKYLLDFISFNTLNEEYEKLSDTSQKENYNSIKEFENLLYNYKIKLMNKEIFEIKKQLLELEVQSSLQKVEHGYELKEILTDLNDEQNNLQKQIDRIEIDITYLYEQICYKLNVDKNTELPLNIDMSYYPISVESLDEYTTIFSDSKAELDEMNFKLDLYKEYNDLLEQTYKKDDEIYIENIMLSEFELLKLNEQKQNKISELGNQYNNYLIYVKEYELVLNQYYLLNKIYEADKKAYESDMISKKDLLESNIKLLNSKIDLYEIAIRN